MAGTVSVTRTNKRLGDTGKRINIVAIAWTADAADGSVPDTTIQSLEGYVLKGITNPGGTAPTANYDVKLLDATETTVDGLNGLLENRSATATETAVASGMAPLLIGDYVFNLTGNSVNSASGTCVLYLSDSL